jgi:hypothetical protein
MSFWKSLFGGSKAASAPKASDPVEYKGYVIRAAPFKEGVNYQTAGTIEKEVGGVRKEHRFIRADSHPAYDDAVSFSISKARQMIDQMGDRLFE